MNSIVTPWPRNMQVHIIHSYGDSRTDVCHICQMVIKRDRPMLYIKDSHGITLRLCLACAYAGDDRLLYYLKSGERDAISDIVSGHLGIEIRRRQGQRRPREEFDFNQFVLYDDYGKPYGLTAYPGRLVESRTYILRPDYAARYAMWVASPIASRDYLPAFLHVLPYKLLVPSNIFSLEAALGRAMINTYLKQYRGLSWGRCRHFMSYQRYLNLYVHYTRRLYGSICDLLNEAISWGCPYRLRLARRFPMQVRLFVYGLACLHHNYVQLLEEVPSLIAYLVDRGTPPELYYRVHEMVINGIPPKDIAAEVKRSTLVFNVHPAIAFFAHRMPPAVLPILRELRTSYQQKLFAAVAFALHPYRHTSGDVKSLPFWIWLIEQIKRATPKTLPLRFLRRNATSLYHYCAMYMKERGPQEIKTMDDVVQHLGFDYRWDFVTAVKQVQNLRERFPV